MSYRAIQRLREEREAALGDEDRSDSDEDYNDFKPAANSGFAATFMDDSSSSDEESNEEEEDTSFDKNLATEASEKKLPRSAVAPVPVPTEEKEKDFDELLNEFKLQDFEEPIKNDEYSTTNQWFDIIVSSIDIRHLDFDFVMRTSLHGGGDFGQSSRSGGRRSKQCNIFGPPKDRWPRAPRYVGGGLGMETYENSPRPLPWPYSDFKSGDIRCPPNQKCFSFQHSDAYFRDYKDYERVQMSGDVNMLLLFCSHHPYAPIDAMIQISTVLNQVNENEKAREFLQRALWIYECSFLNSFIKKSFGFMDHDIPSNKMFFETLFRMLRVSHVAGLPKSALAYSKLLLSLDPLRDPKNVLLILDHFVLLANSKEDDQWLVDFVGSKTISVFGRNTIGTSEYECKLEFLPNIAYSYALALYRISKRDKTSKSEEEAKKAMKRAILNFPSVFEGLLAKNEIDASNNRFQKALEFTAERSILVFNAVQNETSRNEIGKNKAIQARIIQAYNLIARIFVEANFKLWSLSEIQYFMLSCVEDLKKEPVTPLNPALLRFANCDPCDFIDRFQTMPAEANPIDQRLLAHAMHVDTNRPRFMQRAAQGGRDGQGVEMIANAQRQGFAGPPTDIVDPDWPLLEVFWRSALPWAHVEGVERPPG